MKIPKTCIICGSKTLDTSMTIRLHDQEHEVWICNEHEETTPKQAKDALKIKLDKFDELADKASEYGMILIPEEEYKLLTNVPKNKQQIQPQEINADMKPKIIKTAQKVHSASGAVSGVNVEQHDSYAVGRTNDTVVEMQKVTLKNGAEVAIPTSIKGSDGAAEIRIVSGVDDKMLQAHTNVLSKKSHMPGFKGSKYGSDCPACRGAGIHPISKSQCPKCGGTGVLIS